MSDYRPRWLAPRLRQAVGRFPVVLLDGAPGVGKTTVLKNTEPVRNWRYLTLEDFEVSRQVRTGARDLWAGSQAVVLDEVQRAESLAQLILAVRQTVELEPSTKFVLSASAGRSFWDGVGGILPGYATHLTLGPMTLGELNTVHAPPTLEMLLGGKLPREGAVANVDVGNVFAHMLRGFLPQVARIETPPDWTRWWEQFSNAFVERDVHHFSSIARLADVRKVMEILAQHSDQVLNRSQIGRLSGITQPTVHRYVDLLQASGLFAPLLAYTPDGGRQVVRAPVVFWFDPGLAAFLCGLRDVAGLQQTREMGGFFETLLLSHLRVFAGLMTPPARIYHWRTRAGHRVDFVVEHGRRLLGISVRRANRGGFGDGDGLRAFLARHPHANGLLLGGSPRVQLLGDRLAAIPWTTLVAAA